jgi:hypothetical protein
MHKKHIHAFARILILAISILVIAGLVILWVTHNASRPSTSGGNPVDEQQPSQQQTGPITFDNLTSGQLIHTPYTVTGMVKGWFFEGSFPVYIYDNTGSQIGTALAKSSQDWMTANPIPFSVTIPLLNYTGGGSIKFMKDNPSGEAQNDESYSVFVIFQ